MMVLQLGIVGWEVDGEKIVGRKRKGSRWGR
jgi:hypothetical protein